MRTFLERGKNGRKQPYSMSVARACVRAHACTRTDKQEEACTHKGIAAVHTKKNRLKNRSRPEETTETRKNLPIFGLYFLKDRSKKHMLRTENIFLHTRNSMKKEDLRRDKEDIRRLEKNA